MHSEKKSCRDYRDSRNVPSPISAGNARISNTGELDLLNTEKFWSALPEQNRFSFDIANFKFSNDITCEIRILF